MERVVEIVAALRRTEPLPIIPSRVLALAFPTTLHFSTYTINYGAYSTMDGGQKSSPREGLCRASQGLSGAFACQYCGAAAQPRSRFPANRTRFLAARERRVRRSNPGAKERGPNGGPGADFTMSNSV